MARGPKIHSGKTRTEQLGPRTAVPHARQPSRSAPSQASDRLEPLRSKQFENDVLHPGRRDTHNQPTGFWIWGRHAAAAAMSNPDRKLLRVVLTAEIAEDPAIAAKLAKLESTPSHVLPKEEIQRLLPAGAVHQGLALLTRPLPAMHIEDLIDKCHSLTEVALVALDQVTDPHNVGAILRSAAAFGAAGVVMPERHAPEIAGTLAKAASGAVDHLMLVRAVNLSRALDQLKRAGFWCIGLDGSAEASLATLKPSGRVCLVLGSEGEGLRRLTREACDLMARLPTGGPVASLNVSNAAAVALYEITRRRPAAP